MLNKHLVVECYDISLAALHWDHLDDLIHVGQGVLVQFFVFLDYRGER